MKTIFFVVLLFCCFPHFSSAHVIGEVFEETVYGKPTDRTKIEGGQSKKMPEKRIYTVTTSSRVKTLNYVIVVSSKTGKVVKITSWHDDLFGALQWAAYYCEGGVSFPTRMYWDSGMPIENVPGSKYQDARFTISIHREVGDSRDGRMFRLEVECADFMFQ